LRRNHTCQLSAEADLRNKQFSVTVAMVIAIADSLTAESAYMIAYLVRNGRVFELTPSDWSVLLVGVTFSALLTLFI